MARLESKQIMGYLLLEERHYTALFSLPVAANPAVNGSIPLSWMATVHRCAATSSGCSPRTMPSVSCGLIPLISERVG
jgi:hypothetical protein